MDRPVRKDIRLDNYDYSRNGAYFITICTKNKMCIFWDNNDKYKPIADNQPPIVGAASRRPQNNDKKIHLSEYGKIVKNELYKIPTIYSDIVFIPKFVIMPNHVHLILVVNNDNNNGRRNAAPTVSRIMNQFKGCVSRQSGFSVWQKSFYDRVLRNEWEYRNAWQYIENNPINWENDELFCKE
ncbi:transposase [Ruminococcus flavefaciens]|jgi:REP element-mobilizing transposase RayT|uniref:transposase n=1 Tax=Ruminococcus flavefaciens TaxID=1265 RepID=UPI00048F84E5|nr:transposase [Ruminococcus flavefaciens]